MGQEWTIKLVLRQSENYTKLVFTSRSSTKYYSNFDSKAVTKVNENIFKLSKSSNYSLNLWKLNVLLSFVQFKHTSLVSKSTRSFVYTPSYSELG